MLGRCLSLLALAVALAVVPTASARVPNACTLLTAAEVNGALSSAFRQRTAEDVTKDSARCIWHDAPRVTRMTQARLVLQVSNVSRVAFERALSNQAGVKRVRGVGERAYFFRKHSSRVWQHHTLFVWADGVAVGVFIDASGSPLKTTTMLARSVLERL